MVVRENSELASHFDTANWRKSLEAAVKAAVHGTSFSNNARMAGPSGGGDANHADDSIPQRAASVTSTLSLPLTGPRLVVRSASHYIAHMRSKNATHPICKTASCTYNRP